MIDPAGILGEGAARRPAPDGLAMTRVFSVAPGVLWRLFTEPAHFAAWWGPRGARCTRCELDVRVGGAWRTDILGEESGRVSTMHGAYRAVEPTHRLVFTWTFGEPPAPRDAPISEVTLEFGARGAGSELRLFHAALPADMAESHERGWASSLDDLEAHIAREGL